VLGRKADMIAHERDRTARALGALSGDLRRAGGLDRRRRELEHLARALDAHDPDRTLERGFALVHDDQGELVTTAQAARDAGRVRIAFADAAVAAKIEDQP
jgi:exodeoxyribonuclease VII large subunit